MLSWSAPESWELLPPCAWAAELCRSLGLNFSCSVHKSQLLITEPISPIIKGVEKILNLQPKDGKGKPYQVKLVRDVILTYYLRIGK